MFCLTGMGSSVSGATEAKPSLFQSITNLNCMGWVQVGGWGAEAPTEAREVSRRRPELVVPLFLVPSSVLAKGEEDAHSRKTARSSVTACFPLTGESHQHLGIQELLHRVGPSSWGCGSCEANGKFGRVSMNLLPKACGDGQRRSCVFTFTSWQKC